MLKSNSDDDYVVTKVPVSQNAKKGLINMHLRLIAAVDNPDDFSCVYWRKRLTSNEDAKVWATTTILYMLFMSALQKRYSYSEPDVDYKRWDIWGVLHKMMEDSGCYFYPTLKDWPNFKAPTESFSVLSSQHPNMTEGRQSIK